MTVVLAIGALRDCAPAQEVREMAWGFDGVHVAPGFFNPLTVVVHNPGNAPFDDVLLLIESNGLTDVGAPIVERCYLAPGATRVVQFHPFVSDIDGSWWLRWASARFARNAVRPAPSVAWRGLVVLHEGQTMREPVNEMPTFPAAWFPAVPGAAEALAHVVLDFAPEWDDARAGAFLAWLRAGNTVHLVPRDGRPPTFGAGPLALLDDPRPHFAVGAGRAVRHDRPLGALKPGDLERPPLPPKEIQPPAQARAPDVLRTLQLALLPDHPWELIFLAAFAYVGCVGPVHWLLARRRIDWRLSIAYLLAIVAAFTVLFGWLGARGYDEVSRVRTIAYGKVCGDGELAVTQYTNAFVTTGGRREIRPRAEASLLSTAQTREAVDGTIDNGTNGTLEVSMPMFSARGLVHRAHYRIADLPRLRAMQDGSREVLEVEGGSLGPPLGGYLVRHGRISRLSADGTLLREELQVRYGGPVMPLELDEPALLLVCERLQLVSAATPVPAMHGERVFVLFRSPDALHLDAGDLGAEDSHILLDFDLNR
ncbi:MAG TPA: hypothetical protein VK081_10650 [Planctomycetota bacterium]|nr:hypothetical protein [Planctomycetota bacterium]